MPVKPVLKRPGVSPLRLTWASVLHLAPWYSQAQNELVTAMGFLLPLQLVIFFSQPDIIFMM